MADELGELIEKAFGELGQDAADDQVAAKVNEYIKALSGEDSEAVIDRIVRGASTTQLAHLRQITGATMKLDDAGAIPEPSPADGGPASPASF